MAYLQKVKIVSGGTTTYHNLTKFLYGTCSTAAATAAKVVTCADMGPLEDGVTVFVKFTNTNSVADPTLNVNGTGAKYIFYDGTEKPAATDTPWNAGAVVAFTYNGTGWVMSSSGGGNTQAGNIKEITVTIPAGQTSHDVEDSWITADTACYAHDLDRINTLRSTILWAFVNGYVFFNLDQAVSEDLTFHFGMIKPS